MAVQCNNRLGGATIVLSAGCPHSVEIYGRELQTKSQRPSCSPGLGAVVTNDLCLMTLLS